MIVYVESDFVLKLALRQDDHRTARRLVQLAQQRRISLKLPAFSLSEPIATVRYRANNRHRLLSELRAEARELGRTEPHAAISGALRQNALQMANVVETQLDALESLIRELSRICELLPLDMAVLDRAALYRAEQTLQLQDAIVLASIVLDLERGPGDDEALFISQNVKDFERQSITELLNHLRCKYLADFSNAVRYVERPGG